MPEGGEYVMAIPPPTLANAPPSSEVVDIPETKLGGNCHPGPNLAIHPDGLKRGLFKLTKARKMFCSRIRTGFCTLYYVRVNTMMGNH